MKRIVLLALIWLVVMPCLAEGMKAWTWTDANGRRVVSGTKPPPSVASATVIRVPIAPIVSAPPPATVKPRPRPGSARVLCYVSHGGRCYHAIEGCSMTGDSALSPVYDLRELRPSLKPCSNCWKGPPLNIPAKR